MQQLSSKNRLSISNFTFTFSGYGHYKVTFFGTRTNKTWNCTTSNMPLIDCTKNADDPKQKDLITLKKLCKNGNN